MTNLDFTWTLDVVQWATTPSGWRWLCVLEQRLPNRISTSSANDPPTGMAVTGSHAPRVLAALHVTPTSVTRCGGRLAAPVSKACWSPPAWTGETDADLMVSLSLQHGNERGVECRLLSAHCSGTSVTA